VLWRSNLPDQHRLRPHVNSRQEDIMDAFFIIPILVLLALLAWCVLQLKDDM
jgi:hypothetical protein